ncbi:hypothetical protein V8G54_024520, partial [Vigna mungo]
MDTNFPIEATRIEVDKVYTKRKKIPDMMQVHESNPSSAPENEEIPELENEIDLPIAIRKGTRNCTKKPLYPLSNYVSYDRLSANHKSFIVNLNYVGIPNNITEALAKKEWRDAMQVEMIALEKNNTWEIVDKPKEKNIVDCKWIFTVKYNADGS